MVTSHLRVDRPASPATWMGSQLIGDGLESELVLHQTQTAHADTLVLGRRVCTDLKVRRGQGRPSSLVSGDFGGSHSCS